MTAADLKQELAVANPRDAMTSTQLAAVMLTELVAKDKMIAVDAYGNQQTRKITLKTACNIARAIED